VNDSIVSGDDEGRREERCRREVLKSTRWVWRCVRKSEIISRLSGFLNVLRPNRCLSVSHPELASEDKAMSGEDKAMRKGD
jgi:hypothetical protein